LRKNNILPGVVVVAGVDVVEVDPNVNPDDDAGAP